MGFVSTSEWVALVNGPVAMAAFAALNAKVAAEVAASAAKVMVGVK